jgi:hypothetical protein
VLSGRHDYRTVEGEELYIHPGSVIWDREPRPALITAGQLIKGEARTYARQVLPLRLPWLQRVCPELLAYLHRDVRYDELNDRVLAEEEVYFRQLTIASGETVDLFKRAPERALDVLIRDGLLADRLGLGLDFHRNNESTLEEARRLAFRLGKPELAPEEHQLVAWYSNRLSGCRSAADIRRRIKGDITATLGARLDDFLGPELVTAAHTLYPEQVELAGVCCPVNYVYNPWSGRRNATIRVPLAAASRLQPLDLLLAIPGLADAHFDAWLEAAQLAGVLDAATRAELFATRLNQEHPETRLTRRLGPLDPAIASAARTAVDEARLEPTIELLDDAGKTIGSACGTAELVRLLRQGAVEEAWRAAREAFESVPTEQLSRVERLFEPPLLEPVRIWGDVHGDEVVAVLGVRRSERGWSRHLYRDRDLALQGSRDALAESRQLRLRLDRARFDALNPRLDAALDRRALEATGEPAFGECVRRWLLRLACGGFLDRTAFRQGQLGSALEAAEQLARRRAPGLAGELDAAFEQLLRLRRRARANDLTPASATLLDRGCQQLRQLERLEPAQLDALLAELAQAS